MPTQRSRYMITESDELSQTLDQAASIWPECQSRQELLRLIIEEGSKALVLRVDNVKNQRLSALNSLQKLGTGMWPADFDEQRKSEWDA
jgi:hypothetical protein